MTWRPLPGGRPPPRRLAESLDEVSQALGAPHAASLAAVFRRWEEIVGAVVAAHARPVSLVRGVLTVAVDQPAWRTHLAYLERDLLRRVAEVAGEGTAISVRLVVRGR